MTKLFLLATTLVLGGSLSATGIWATTRRSVQAPTGSTAASSIETMTATTTEADVEARIVAALVTEKPVFVDRCWRPLTAKAPQPSTSTFDFAIAVNPEGREVMRAVGERQQEPSRADVAECLRGLDVRITTAPPGRYVSVKVPVTFSS